MARTKLEAFVEDSVSEALEEIDNRLEEINKKLEVFDRVKVQRDRLMSARRALMGVGSRTTANAGMKITQDEVAAALRDNGDGMTAGELMAAIPGSNDGQIRGHLNRGAGERFLKRPSDNRWFLRDPEAGVDEVDDLPEED